jgi:hypothetical protein
VDVMEQLVARCHNFTFWHKLYADDLVSWTYTLRRVSEEFAQNLSWKWPADKPQKIRYLHHPGPQ